MRRLLFDWGVGLNFGWGVYGFNLLLHNLLAENSQFFSLGLAPSDDTLINLYGLKKFFLRQSESEARVRAMPSDIVLTALGNHRKERLKLELPSLGVIFFEDSNLDAKRTEFLKSFDLVVTGSSWNDRLLKSLAIRTQRIFQGVDPSLFFPRPKRLMKNRFVVFSGGKLEYRKGQDLVVMAFAKFAEKYPDAILVCSWSSPWSLSLMDSINKGIAAVPIRDCGDFSLSVSTWLFENRIRPSQFHVLPAVPNYLMPHILSETDVALFPNRCEGGTNLVAMEALASNIPTVLSKNTGHLDLCDLFMAEPLLSQKPIPGKGTLDWGESDVDEIVETLELIYSSNRKGASDQNTEHASAFPYTWAKTFGEWQSLVKDL